MAELGQPEFLLPPDGAENPQPDEAPEINDFEERPDLPTFTSYALFHTLEGHTDAVVSVRFNKAGTRVASGSSDGTVKVWDVESGRLLLTLQGSNKRGVSDVAWSPDGRTIASCTDGCEAMLWNTETGALRSVLRGHTHHVVCCRFSPRGNIVATCSFDETVRLWDVQTGREVGVIPAHSDPVMAVDFSSDKIKPILLSASLDGICRIWSPATRECIVTILPDADSAAPVTFASFTPNAKFLLLGKLNGRLQLWDYSTPVPDRQTVSLKKVYSGHKNSRLAVQAAFLVNDPSGNKYVVSGSEDHHVYVWDLNKRSIVGLVRGRRDADAPGEGHCDVVHGVDVSPTAPMLATSAGGRDATVKLWKYTG